VGRFRDLLCSGLPPLSQSRLLGYEGNSGRNCNQSKAATTNSSTGFSIPFSAGSDTCRLESQHNSGTIPHTLMPASHRIGRDSSLEGWDMKSGLAEHKTGVSVQGSRMGPKAWNLVQDVRLVRAYAAFVPTKEELPA